MRIQWTNLLDIVDAHIEANNLNRAKKFAKRTLEREDAELMLSEKELTYLKLIIKLPEIKDLKTLDDLFGDSND